MWITADVSGAPSTRPAMPKMAPKPIVVTRTRSGFIRSVAPNAIEDRRDLRARGSGYLAESRRRALRADGARQPERLADIERGHQMTTLEVAAEDAVDHDERIVDGAEFRNPAHDPVVERQFATIAKLHDGDRGQGLGDRSPVKDGLAVDRCPFLAVCITMVVAADNAPVFHQHHARAYHVVAVRVSLERARELGPAGWRLRRGDGTRQQSQGNGKTTRHSQSPNAERANDRESAVTCLAHPPLRRW